MEQYRHRTLIPLFEELRGPQVVVRPYRLEDAEEVFAAVDESREHLWPWLPWVVQHQTVEDTRDFILRTPAKWLLREDLTVGIFEASSGRYLGGSGLHTPAGMCQRSRLATGFAPAPRGTATSPRRCGC